jgi:hypothetical protein
MEQEAKSASHVSRNSILLLIIIFFMTFARALAFIAAALPWDLQIPLILKLKETKPVSVRS